jgi:hypothetical protein
MGNEFFGKKGEKPSDEKPQPRENPKPKPIPFHCDHCGRDDHLAEFCFRGSGRRGLLGRWQKIRTGTTLLVVRLSLMLCLGVRALCIPSSLGRGVSFLHGVCLLKETVVGVLGLDMVSLLDVSSLVANTTMGGTITTLGLRGAMDHGLHLMVLIVLLGDMWVFHLEVIGWILLTPLLSKWHNTGLIPFTLTTVLSHLHTLALIFYFAGGRHGELLVD